MEAMRTAACGALCLDDAGDEHVVCGWVNVRRDHGGVIFIDLRDHSGMVQVVFEPSNADAFSIAEAIRPEHVVRVTGSVRPRPGETANKNLPTGDIEILANGIEHLNSARSPAFYPDDEEVTEDTRLEHRLLHLRSTSMQSILRTRHKMAAKVRNALDAEGFVEIETPLLTKSTPEGARDYLVPARVQQGHFYALPQSPQLFKQVIVAGGFERYYQFARCFRDEDLRSGRQPEFTQIDVEMAFVGVEEVIEAAEKVVNAAWVGASMEELGSVPRMGYDEAMSRYGCDSPDLSVDLELQDVKDIADGCGFKVLAEPAAQDEARVVALNAPGGSTLSRKQIDELTDFVRKLGAGGLAYLKVDSPGNGISGVSSPIAKFLGDDVVDKMTQRCGSKAGDIVFFGAGETDVVNGYMAPLRVEIGRLLGIVKEGSFPVWIVDFPLYLKDRDSGALTSVHHPFTAPKRDAVEKLLAGEQLTSIKSDSYDLVINGVELGGGSIRIHESRVQLAALSALGIEEQEAQSKFGFLMDALNSGAPPHGGFALGFDRMVAMAVGAPSIRDVIAFPKTQRGVCRFTDAPQPVGATQLNELGLTLSKKPKA